MTRENSVNFRVYKARLHLKETQRDNPEHELTQQIVQVLADLRLLCDREGVDFGYLSECSEGHARSYKDI